MACGCIRLGVVLIHVKSKGFDAQARPLRRRVVGPACATNIVGAGPIGRAHDLTRLCAAWYAAVGAIRVANRLSVALTVDIRSTRLVLELLNHGAPGGDVRDVVGSAGGGQPVAVMGVDIAYDNNIALHAGVVAGGRSPGVRIRPAGKHRITVFHIGANAADGIDTRVKTLQVAQ